MPSSGPVQAWTTTSLSSSAVYTSSSLYAAVGSVMEKPVKMPETDSGENKKVFERLFVQLSKETSEIPQASLDEALALAARGRSWSRAMKLLRLPTARPTRDQYHMAIVACKRAQHKWRQALELIDEAVARGLQPNATSFQEVMSICAVAQRPKEAVSVLDRMGKAGVNAGLSSYNIAVSALAHQGQWKKALKIITYMEKQAVWPDTKTYTSAMEACAKAGEWQRALLLLEEMVAQKGVPPSTPTYNAAMRACVVGGQDDRALAFLDEMLRKGVGVDEDSFGIAIKACEGAKRKDKALELWQEEMPRQSLPPSLPPLEALLRVLVKTEREVESWPAACAIIDALPPSSPSSSSPSLTQADGAMALVRAARSLQLPAEGPGEEGVVGKYVVGKLLAAGRVGEAVRLCSEEDRLGFAVMREGGREGGSEESVACLGVLLQWREAVRMRQGAGPCAKPDLVRTRLEMEMKESGVLGKEDEEMNAVKALCEDGELDAAIERIRSKGGKPRPSVVNLAMEYAVVIFKDVAAAKKILEIPGAGSRPFYNRALRVAAAAKRWGTVASLQKKMTMNGIVSDAETFLQLIVGSTEAESLTRVQRYHHQMEKEGFATEPAHAVALMAFYNDKRKYSLSLAVFQEQVARNSEAGGEQREEMTRLALEACAIGGLWEEVQEIAAAARLSVEEDAAARTALLEAMARAGGMVGEVEKRVRGLESGKSLDVAAGNALLRAYQVEGRVEEATSTLQAMESGLFGVPPSAASYEIVMAALAATGVAEREAEAASLFARQQPPSSEGFRLALTCLCRGGRYKEALGLLPALGDTCNVDPSDNLLKAAMKAALGMGTKESLPALRKLAASSPSSSAL